MIYKQHGQAAWTCSKDIRDVHETWTRSMDMQHVDMTFSIDMQHVHAAKNRAWAQRININFEIFDFPKFDHYYEIEMSPDLVKF
jgi:hypothetical protein